MKIKNEIKDLNNSTKKNMKVIEQLSNEVRELSCVVDKYQQRDLDICKRYVVNNIKNISIGENASILVCKNLKIQQNHNIFFCGGYQIDFDLKFKEIVLSNKNSEVLWDFMHKYLTEYKKED